MNTGQIEFFEKQCDEFEKERLSELLGVTKYSHLICEAARLSKYGLGGAAHRNWVSGLYVNGVYFFAHNHKIEIWVASNPIATPVKGCQDSCANGNPFPSFSGDEKWWPYAKIPSSVKERVDIILNVMIRSRIITAVRNEIERQKIAQKGISDKKKSELDILVTNWTI